MDMRLARFLFVAAFFLLPMATSAASQHKPFEVSGWIPYWRAATGTADVLPNLDTLTEVNPFVYTLKSDGTFLDNGKLDEEPWKTLREEARKRNIRFIPTVMTSNSDLVHQLLKSKKKRVALEDYIEELVREKDFDGIDIDFEGKKAATKEYFSTFLKGLADRLDDKWLMCTIESRTPPEDRYFGTTVPPDAGVFANDLKAIGKYCDRVRIMAYDQQGIDQKLVVEADQKGELYAPVGDPRWVGKVVNLMARDIPKNKLMIGIPTYGYEYDVRAYAGPQYVYDILWTFNPGYAIPIAVEHGVTPQRNASGEIFFTYNPGTSSPPVAGTPNTALLAASAASLIATTNNTNLTFRMMTWPDAESVRQKVELAKRLNVRGVSIFKFDGGQDPNMWGALRSATSSTGAPPAPAPSASIPVAPGPSTNASFTRALELGSVGEDVRSLQKILNADPDTRVAASGPGSSGNETTRFGALTLQAVQKFQVKHGLAKPGDAGYGYVGPKTRAKLQAI